MLTDKIKELIEPTLTDMGIDIVSITLQSGEKRNELEILIDRTDGQGVSIDLCGKVSHTISALLDVEDIIDKRYNLIVSSAGINRPLNKYSDFERFIGEDIFIQTKTSIDNRKNFNGKLISCKNNQITINCENTYYEIEYDNILKAHLDKIKNLFSKNNKRSK